MSGGRRLKGRVQRVVRDARTADGRHARAFQEAVIAQWPALPDVALRLLREAARIDLELQHAGDELDAARAATHGRGKVADRARRDVARVRRCMVPLRGQLSRLIAQIEALANSQPGGEASDLARRLRAVNP